MNAGLSKSQLMQTMQLCIYFGLLPYVAVTTLSRPQLCMFANAMQTMLYLYIIIYVACIVLRARARERSVTL